MEATNEEKRVTYFHCSVCQERTPWGEPHRCALTPRQQRSLDAHRLAEKIALTKRTAPVRCEYCSKTKIRGQGHFCSGPVVVDHAHEMIQAAQTAQLVATLEAAGFTRDERSR